MAPTPSHEGGHSVREQIERYRSSFIAVVTMVLIAAAVGGYILAHQNLHLPGWVPVLGRDFYTLKANFQTAQAVTPGQGQAVTIAGAKVGEVKSVNLHRGVATVEMTVTPKYARFYHNATLLLRPKTALQDITVEVNPGTPSAGRLHSGELLPVSQTAPNVNFDEFLAGLDADTRFYLQALLAGAGEGLNHNGKALSATLKRFLPTARYGREIAKELELRHENIARSIHNFRLLVEALGGKDQQLAQLVDASNAVFSTFAKEDASLRRTLHLLPGALSSTATNLDKLKTASQVLGPTLTALNPFAKALAPAQEASRKSALETTPLIKNDIRPFAREIEPVVNELGPSTQQLAEAFPKLTVSFTVLTEFFNELAYNPGKNKAGFIFFTIWGNHELNSVVSTADANGPLGRSLVYFNCEVLPLLKAVSSVNENVKLLVKLLNPPSKAECESEGLSGKGAATAASASAVKHITSFEGFSLTPFGPRAVGSRTRTASTGAAAHSASPAAGKASATAHAASAGATTGVGG
jgi:phospholipid/cholesterol/gamma-HCH transport system substrate-binding protein